MSESISIMPNWEKVAEFQAVQLAQAMDSNGNGGKNFVASFIEVIRFLSIKQPEAIVKLISDLEK